MRDLNSPSGAGVRYQQQPQQQQQPQARFEEEAVPNEMEEEIGSFKKSFSNSASTSRGVTTLVGALIFPEEANQNYNLYAPTETDAEPFDETVRNILSAPINDNDIEIKPDGPLYLPEVRYRRILLSAFGPGAWSLLPRGPHTLLPPNILTREYALFVRGRIVSVTRGAVVIQGQANAASGSESVRSNALMRCCKDLGVASELWDPQFTLRWRERFAVRKNITDRYGNTKYIFTKRTASNE